MTSNKQSVPKSPRWQVRPEKLHIAPYPTHSHTAFSPLSLTTPRDGPGLRTANVGVTDLKPVGVPLVLPAEDENLNNSEAVTPTTPREDQSRRPTLYRAPIDMSGWVLKYQSRLPTSVRRYFRLSDSTLYNQSQLTSKPTWQLSVSRAIVRADYDRKLVTLTCPSRSLRFQLTTASETNRWLEALRVAATCNISDFYTIGETIGTGSFGTVCSAVDKLTSVPRAVKIVHRTSNQKEREFVHREMSVLLTISHPNIVRTYDIFDERHRVLVVMAFISGGDMFEYMIQRDQIGERTVKHAMWQVMQGVAYLHSRNIVHRDIKLENVLVARKNPLWLQLTDFGFANFVDPGSEGANRDLNSLVGTGSYMAPEVIDGTGHGKPVDIFASGVLMFRMIAGHMPFRAISWKESYQLAVDERADFTSGAWTAVAKEARALCSWMLKANPDKRPTASEVLKHDWFERDPVFLTEAAMAESAARQKEEKELAKEQDLADRYLDMAEADSSPNVTRMKQSKGSKN